MPVIWLGPDKKKLTTYSVGKFISRNISAYSRINLIGNHSNGEYNLNILNVSTDDVGTYQCQSVQNGTAVQRTFILNILGIPAKVVVRVTSLQVPTISWTHNVGGRLGDWTATANGSSSYLLRSTVSPTVMEHFGQYGIKVRNGAGSIDLTLKLLLIEYPVTVRPSTAFCYASTGVTLVCQFAVEDTTGWQSYWTHNRNGNFIKTVPGFINGNKSTLQITFCDYREEGDYICKWKTQFKEYSASSFLRANEYEGQENHGSNEQDNNEHLESLHEYEDIESIVMNEVDDSNTEYHSTAEIDIDQEQDVGNPSGITSEAHSYQDMDESKFEMHTYTEYQ
ncbi:Hypothetical predicted protein [Mytilus galloprovincialis]|uniref:Ig-like domain-containing protein n=1 Tax=Mytilus galloprovincialis TaxID=29158 RepID=A0A8B6H4W0_MYTGA|nr:Hypothetical predicted protein [Mytilus galloprovincialis]